MNIGIVTGASSGMGKEFVNTILKSDMDLDEIWVVARREERLKTWQQHYPEKGFRIFSLDLQKREDLEKISAAITQYNPKIKVFVHSAGFGVMGKIEELSREEQMEMVEVNCRSVVSLTCAVLPYMESGGRLIYIASAAAFLPQPGFAVYAASKAFVLSYVRSLRREVTKRNIKITAVCPGAVKTEFFNRATVHKPLPAYKKMVMADLKKVVKKAWKDNEKDKEISVYGKAMKSFWVTTKIVPHNFFLHFMRK